MCGSILAGVSYYEIKDTALVERYVDGNMVTPKRLIPYEPMQIVMVS
jgi:hypothetical protein